MGELRGLSLRQPWASLVAFGAKKIETRSWKSPYRGWLAIHASATFTRQDQELAITEPFYSCLESGVFPSGTPDEWPRSTHEVIDSLPLGAYVAVARLVACENTGLQTRIIDLLSDRAPDPASAEWHFGNYAPGRWMWFLEDVVELQEPIWAKGMLGVFALSPESRQKIIRQCPFLLQSWAES